MQYLEAGIEKIWTIIIGYLISATVKDFTIILRIADEPNLINNLQVQEANSRLKNEKVLEFNGKLYRVRIGVIDLEAKMYTKLPVYLKEAEEAYLNFVKYHNK